eukprot:GILK01006726.1.p1 GENE.GILK01006726.1~~GILK01006726.1.p1  ORF type:complete len:307 (-),score=37.03 GILK01006726.1:502-1389(-)
MTTSKPATSGHGANPMPFWKNVVAGASAGLVEVLIMYPLDVVKTRSQLTTSQSVGVFATLRNIVRQEGLNNLYRGIISPVLAEAPKRAVKFASNEFFKQHLKSSDGKLSTAKGTLAGALAGVTEAFVNCPFEVIKVRMQAKENLGRYASTSDCAVQLLKQEGVFALYKGLEPQMLRNAAWNGPYFGLIGFFHNKFQAPADATSAEKAQRNFIAGTIAGSIATCFNTPLDVVKSRMQNQLPGQVVKYKYALPSVFIIYREEGLRACYKGLAARLYRLGPGGGIMQMAFVLVSDLLK